MEAGNKVEVIQAHYNKRAPGRKKAVAPIAPGEILLEEYLQPMGISQNAMGCAIGVAPGAINEIVLGRPAITPTMSIRFGEFFGQSPQFWHGLQVECDFRSLRSKEKALKAKIISARELMAA